MTLFERLADVQERWNVLRHPFYTRWERGGLSTNELAYYAGEYRHAVVALARQARRPARITPPRRLRTSISGTTSRAPWTRTSTGLRERRRTSAWTLDRRRRPPRAPRGPVRDRVRRSRRSRRRSSPVSSSTTGSARPIRERRTSRCMRSATSSTQTRAGRPRRRGDGGRRRPCRCCGRGRATRELALARRRRSGLSLYGHQAELALE